MKYVNWYLNFKTKFLTITYSFRNVKPYFVYGLFSNSLLV